MHSHKVDMFDLILYYVVPYTKVVIIKSLLFTDIGKDHLLNHRYIVGM